MGREKVGDTGKGKKEKGGLKKFEVGTKGYFDNKVGINSSTLINKVYVYESLEPNLVITRMPRTTPISKKSNKPEQDLKGYSGAF